jgi:hypothetical protein
VEILKRLREAVRRKRPELWPAGWILYNENAAVNKALSVKQFLDQKSVTEMVHRPLFSDFFSEWLLPISKIKSALKERRFQDTEDNPPKYVATVLKAIPQKSSQTVPNSGSIVGVSAQLLKGSTSKVTPLSKL